MINSVCNHDIVSFTGMQEDGIGTSFPLFTCVEHPVKRVPKLYPCYSTFTDVVYGGSIDFVGSYHFLMEKDDKLYYYKDPKENMNPDRRIT